MFPAHRAVQSIAKAVLAELGPTITARDTECTIAQRAVAMLARHGITETWYHACPAFVLLGSRSCLSISGRDYVAQDEAVGAVNLVTVDLSPMRDGVWGDCARSFYVEDGVARDQPPPRFERGARMQRELHAAMRGFVTPRTTFGELFGFANDMIQQGGFENLDFLGNVGHSIESSHGARLYAERGNARALGEAALFTFEPHIREVGSPWGFKHENIYFFDDAGRATEL